MIPRLFTTRYEIKQIVEIQKKKIIKKTVPWYCCLTLIWGPVNRFFFFFELVKSQKPLNWLMLKDFVTLKKSLETLF